jgi:hypothetical protein
MDLAKISRLQASADRFRSVAYGEAVYSHDR